MSARDERLKEGIRGLAATFLNQESNGSSLITVTKVELSPDGKRATVFITVLPEEKEPEALSFARRQRTELRGKVIKVLDVSHPPFLEVDIDRGEKNRQRIDELSQK